jgi:hypothetical protein
MPVVAVHCSVGQGAAVRRETVTGFGVATNRVNSERSKWLEGGE